MFNMEKHYRNKIIIIIIIIGLSMLEIALLRWKWLKNLTNFMNMWEMTYICGKGLKYLRKG